MSKKKSNGIVMSGLDGSNALAFLAAMGILRTLTMARPDQEVRLSWERDDGAWRPWLSVPYTASELISVLDKALVRKRSDHPTRFAGDDAQIASFYNNTKRGDPIEGDLDRWFAALTNDMHRNATSQMQLTRRDYFVGNLSQIMANTTPALLEKSLFQIWMYDDGLSGQSLHIEPGEDRRHAYQWDQPSGDPNRSKSGNMLGANRLAIESIPLFLGLPSKNPDRLRVTGWTGVRSDDSRWTWPIWQHPTSLEVVRSILSLPELQADKPNMAELREAGIAAAFRCRRILVEKTPNLTPSVALW